VLLLVIFNEILNALLFTLSCLFSAEFFKGFMVHAYQLIPIRSYARFPHPALFWENFPGCEKFQD